MFLKQSRKVSVQSKNDHPREAFPWVVEKKHFQTPLLTLSWPWWLRRCRAEAFLHAYHTCKIYVFPVEYFLTNAKSKVIHSAILKTNDCTHINSTAQFQRLGYFGYGYDVFHGPSWAFRKSLAMQWNVEDVNATFPLGSLFSFLRNSHPLSWRSAVIIRTTVLLRKKRWTGTVPRSARLVVFHRRA